MLQGLRDMYNKPDLRFKSIDQANAVKGALLRDRDQLIILPTGGGKTVTYLLPIYLEKELTTVIILPYVVLVEQVEQLCIDHEISCQVWRGKGHSSGKSQAIIAAVEHGVSTEFQTLLTVLESTNRLARIVLDECHTRFTHSGFREDIRRLGCVTRCVSVPIQLVTATCPPAMVDKIRINFGCQSLDVIRSMEDRKELKYGVRFLEDDVDTFEEANDVMGQWVWKKSKDWDGKDRGLIYCCQTKWAEEMCELFNQRAGGEWCGTYHAKMDEVKRREVLSKWKQGDLKILIATSALGAGLDYGAVRFVVHQGFAQRMIDFCQESGRAGRDGKAAESVVFFWKGFEKEVEWIKQEGKVEMLEWVKMEGCRRKALSVYLHGFGEDCMCRRDAALCDNCEKAMDGAGSLRIEEVRGVKRKRDEEKREVCDAVELKEMIEDIKGKCPLCWMNGKDEDIDHLVSRCP